MITPRFSCSQTDTSVIVSIYCPSVRASDVEIHVDGSLFTLYINPYFLRLNFSHNINGDDASSVKYDLDSGYLTVIITKQVEGQEFKDLDLLARLLGPPPAILQSSIEVLSGDSNEQCQSTMSEREISEAAGNDWRLPQVPAEPEIDLSTRKLYGFLNMYSGYFRHVKHTENEINELGSDAELCRSDERRAYRIRNEDRKFDGEHYMADYVDTDIIEGLLRWEHPHLIDTGTFAFTDDENVAMLNLPRREYLATSRETRGLYLTLVTLLFSYAYESRTTHHDPTPESAWTICSLTPAFSALDPPICPIMDAQLFDKFTHDEIRNALVPSYRRSLAFPLYRSFRLADCCRQDVGKLLSGGRRLVLRCLLEIKTILDHHEVYYVYSKIWLDDFCVWIQAYANDVSLLELATCVTQTEIKKNDMGWELDDLENAARTALELERELDSDDENFDDQ